MKREDIEKAAEQSNFIETSDARERFLIRSGFKAGANWRINSVWYDAKVSASQKSSILICDKYGGVQLNYTGYFTDWAKYVKIYRIEKWAYIKDILPTNE